MQAHARLRYGVARLRGQMRAHARLWHGAARLHVQMRERGRLWHGVAWLHAYVQPQKCKQGYADTCKGCDTAWPDCMDTC